MLLFLCAYVQVQAQKNYAYSSDQLIIEKISENAYRHISYLQTNDFGKVACNGMIIIKSDSAWILDSPTDDATSAELLDFLEEKNVTVKGFVATHFHNDCLGGINEFHKRGIGSYSSKKTAALVEEGVAKPQNIFEGELYLNTDGDQIELHYPGEGHTRDNIIAFYEPDQVLFGGCLVKSVGASKGYTGDANVEHWTQTVQSVKLRYPNVKVVIPGHGDYGNSELLNYTADLFKP
ncbi:subclass B1 metallo-beta-lactamase [Jiulongibacter sp. NS-SX5]|uniref:subclass B1 metallo-beta-lactamase n=1 Tax=Jiulongibacter sp. NS-SX5 TaxID=3463854 RepID=UPI00405A1C2F